MNELEDRLRDAYRGAAGTVRPQAIRELRTTDHVPGRNRGPGGARPWAPWEPRAPWARGRLAGWLVPLGAAAVVTALVLGVLAVIPQAPGRHATPPAAGGHRAAAPPLPAFSVLLDGAGLKVIDTGTGHVAGRAAAPAGQAFTAVAGTGDDRTFLLAADLNPQTACETFLYRVRLNGAGQPSAPVSLPVSGLPGVLPTAVALSADGRTGAFSTVRCAAAVAGLAGRPQAVGGVSLVDMTSGHVTRQWSYVLGDDYTRDLSLSADGSTLAFSMILDNSLVTGVRMLATSTPSGTVDAASRVVLHQPRARYASVGPAQLSPDGKTLYACSTASPAWQQVPLTLASYDRAGQRTRVLRAWPPSYDLSCALVMDPSGRYLLLMLSGTPGSKWVKPKPGAIHGKPTATRLIAINLASGTFRTLSATLSGPAVNGALAW
jgi:hypothetical protein